MGSIKTDCNTQYSLGSIILPAMKDIYILGLLAFVSAEWTCDECNQLMESIAAMDTSEESIKGQIEVLLAEVCPQLENADECVAELPDFWSRLAPIMWTYAFNPEPYCGGLCNPQRARDVTCEECEEGIHGIYDAFEEESTIQALVDYMMGPAFCEAEEDVARCQEVIPALIPLAIPPLLAQQDHEAEKAFCHEVLGVC